MSKGRRRLRRALIIFGVLFIVSLSLVYWYKAATDIAPPQVSADMFTLQDVSLDGDSTLHLGNNFLLKNDLGLYEMYLEGDGYERGLAHGILCKDLIEFQESVFIKQLKQIIPNERYLSMLKYATLFFNRNMPHYIPTEYLEEIYGISKAHPDSFNFIGEKYDRVLNYHAAHDIGHTMQQYMLVGCTSFGAWDGYTKDGKIILGRNFDFYMGEDFARNKVVSFYKPDSGHAFASVSWPGFIGAVSGLNEAGLALTINAAAGDPPMGTKMPIALLTREILQYASNIEEALDICRRRETFVSESILLASAEDGRTVIIEKSPTQTGLYESSISRISCSNHYQSAVFSDEPNNVKNIEESDSPYRLARMNELLDQSPDLDVEHTASILRNKEGLFNRSLGYGNQKAINQLICHHSVIIKPEERKIWVSAPPYNLGKYVCYDLNLIFANPTAVLKQKHYYSDEFSIPEDPFVHSESFRRMEVFRRMLPLMRFFIQHPKENQPHETFFHLFEEYNPHWYHTQELLGDYYSAQGDEQRAGRFYAQALKMEIATTGERNRIVEKLESLSK